MTTTVVTAAAASTSNSAVLLTGSSAVASASRAALCAVTIAQSMLGVAMESRSDMRKLRVGGGDLRPVTNPRTCDGSLPTATLPPLPSATPAHPAHEPADD